MWPFRRRNHIEIPTAVVNHIGAVLVELQGSPDFLKISDTRQRNINDLIKRLVP